VVIRKKGGPKVKGAYYNEFDPKAAARLRELISARLIPNGEVDERSICEVRPDDLEGFIQCHFFAGIGGWSRALQLAGWPADRPVWTMSCPCQPFSCAGKGLGTADERHLWPAAFNLIRQRRPATVFGEQVASAEIVGKDSEAQLMEAIITGNQAKIERLIKTLGDDFEEKLISRWLDGISADMESEGYACGAIVLGAHSLGAPHIRQRLYWVAQSQSEHHDRNEPRRDGSHAAGPVAQGGAVGGVGIPDRPGSQPGRPAAAPTRHRGAAEPDGGPAFWSTFDLIPCRDGKTRRIEPGTFPLVNGLPAGMVHGSDPSLSEVQATPEGRVMRLKGYGNAIVPQVAAEFIRAVMEGENV